MKNSIKPEISTSKTPEEIKEELQAEAKRLTNETTRKNRRFRAVLDPATGTKICNGLGED